MSEIAKCQICGASISPYFEFCGDCVQESRRKAEAAMTDSKQEPQEGKNQIGTTDLGPILGPHKDDPLTRWLEKHSEQLITAVMEEPADEDIIASLRAQVATLTVERDEAFKKEIAAKCSVLSLEAEIAKVREQKRPFADSLANAVIEGQVKRIRELEDKLNGWFIERDRLTARVVELERERDEAVQNNEGVQLWAKDLRELLRLRPGDSCLLAVKELLSGSTTSSGAALTQQLAACEKDRVAKLEALVRDDPQAMVIITAPLGPGDSWRIEGASPSYGDTLAEAIEAIDAAMSPDSRTEEKQ